MPHVRWFLGWMDRNDLNRVFAVVQQGKRKPEAGDVLLSDIVNARLGSIRPERDE